MPYPRTGNPIVAALQLKRACPCPPLQVANGRRSDAGPQVADEQLAVDLDAAWLPTIPGQAIPMIGERGAYDAEPCYDL